MLCSDRNKSSLKERHLRQSKLFVDNLYHFPKWTWIIVFWYRKMSYL